MAKYRLIGLDIDRTLVKDFDSTDLNLDLVNKLQAFPEKTKIALISNQGGPACHDAGWPTSDNYPSLDQVQNRLQEITSNLQQLLAKPVALYVCYAYKTRQGEILLPEVMQDQLETFNWDLWRKPEPGMLLQAQEDAKTPYIEECLYVGNDETSWRTAVAAGWDFAWLRSFLLVEPKWIRLAHDRIVESRQLQDYQQLLLGTDWNEVQYLEWVATADIGDILTWCENMVRNRQG